MNWGYIRNIATIFIISYLFKQYAAPYLVSDESYLVHNFLYNDEFSSVKPYLWIFVPLDENCRVWDSFNERKNIKLNSPYVEHCIKSIIKKNKDYFNVCIITDNDINKIIPHWKFNINELTTPVKERVRRLAKLKLLY